MLVAVRFSSFCFCCLLVLGLVFSARHSTAYVDAACCYRRSSVVCLSVGLLWSWAVQKLPNRSRCHSGCALRWGPGNLVLGDDPDPHAKGAVLWWKGAVHCNKLKGHSAATYCVVIYMTTDLHAELSVCLSVCVCMSVCLFLCMSVCLSVCLPVCPSVHLFVRLCVCRWLWHYTEAALWEPTAANDPRWDQWRSQLRLRPCCYWRRIRRTRCCQGLYVDRLIHLPQLCSDSVAEPNNRIHWWPVVLMNYDSCLEDKREELSVVTL